MDILLKGNRIEHPYLQTRDKFRVVTMPYRYYAHVVEGSIARCGTMMLDDKCRYCKQDSKHTRYVVLAKVGYHDVCYFDFDTFTYNLLSAHNKVNGDLLTDFRLVEKELHGKKVWVIVPILGSSRVTDYFNEPDGWFDKYLDNIAEAWKFAADPPHGKIKVQPRRRNHSFWDEPGEKTFKPYDGYLNFGR